MSMRSGPPEASTLTPKERAYVAGIVDGEGSILIGRRATTSPNYFLKVSITNSSVHLIDWLEEKIGGATVSHRFSNDYHRDMLIWSKYGERAGALIRVIRPYMIIKTEQADLALAFLKGFRSMRGLRNPIVEQLAFRERIYAEMSKLNIPQGKRSQPQRLSEEAPL